MIKELRRQQNYPERSEGDLAQHGLDDRGSSYGGALNSSYVKNMKAFADRNVDRFTTDAFDTYQR